MRKFSPYGRHIKPEVRVTINLVPEQYFGCEGKRKYKSKKNAELALRRIKKTGILVENANIYECEFCQHYHLGHKRKEHPHV